MFSKRLLIVICIAVASLYAACSSPSDPCADAKAAKNLKESFVPGDQCFTRNKSLNVENIGKKDTEISHNTGQNCMQCHQPNGPGLGLFVVAGSVYKDNKGLQGAKIKLFADPARKVVLSELVSDKLGNFYTTQKGKLDYPAKSVFVSVFSPDGKVEKKMRGPKPSGACNQCHNKGGFIIKF